MYFQEPIEPARKNQNEMTEKQKEQEKIKKETEEFLKFGRNKIEYIPVGVSGETYGLNKKQKERYGRKSD